MRQMSCVVWEGLVHDSVIDTLFGDGGLQSLMWVFVLLLGAGSGL